MVGLTHVGIPLGLLPAVCTNFLWGSLLLVPLLARHPNWGARLTQASFFIDLAADTKKLASVKGILVSYPKYFLKKS